MRTLIIPIIVSIAVAGCQQGYRYVVRETEGLNNIEIAVDSKGPWFHVEVANPTGEMITIDWDQSV